MTPIRVFLVGTDTAVGKTTLACTLLRLARVRELRAIPFKPAQSVGADEASDAARLLAAAGLPEAELDGVAPHRFDRPLAPGIAEDAAAFRRPAAANTSPDSPAIRAAVAALARWEVRWRPDLVLIEGAGGLHVPMPGGTWQSAWIQAFEARCVLVGRAGLGTINHSLLTIDALRALGCPPLGFYLCHTTPAPDPSLDDNAPVIAAARGLPHLGTLPLLPSPASVGPLDLLSPLLSALGQESDVEP